VINAKESKAIADEYNRVQRLALFLPVITEQIVDAARRGKYQVEISLIGARWLSIEAWEPAKLSADAIELQEYCQEQGYEVSWEIQGPVKVAILLLRWAEAATEAAQGRKESYA
jgi:hypothetical protein